jgi:hypothetical protein
MVKGPFQRLLLPTVVAVAIGLAAVSAMFQIHYDLTIGYEIGLRHVQGQVLYRNYYVPEGVLWGLLFSVFLHLTPTVGWAIICAAGLMNAAAAVVIWQIVLELTQQRRYAFFGSLMTAFWFLPPIGGAYFDHLAYLLALMAIRVYLSSRPPRLKDFLTTGLFALATHVKPSIGPLAFGAFMVVYLVLLRRASFKQHLTLALFYAFNYLLILALLCSFTDFRKFYECALSVPFSYGMNHKDFTRVLTCFLVPYHINPFRMVQDWGLGRLVFYPVVLLFYVSYFTLYRLCVRERPVGSQRQELVLGYGFLILSTLWGAAISGRSFTHCAFGAGGILALTLFLWQRARTKWLETIPVILFCGLALIVLAQHCSIFDKQGSASCINKELFPIRVKSEPDIPLNHVAAVINYLTDKPGDICVIDNLAYLIPLALRRAPINPWVEYFNLDDYILAEPSLLNRWQLEFIAALEKQPPRYFISTLGTGSPLEFSVRGGDFIGTLRVLYSHVRQRYRLVYQSGPIQVYQRVDLPPAVATSPSRPQTDGQ